MLDVLVQQLMLDLMLEVLDKGHVAVAGDHQVGREGIFRRADGPYMDVVQVLNAIYAKSNLSQVVYVDVGRYPIKG